MRGPSVAALLFTLVIANAASPAEAQFGGLFGGSSSNNRPANAGNAPISGPILQGAIAAVPGPKRTIAVGGIDTIGGLTGGPNGWNVGGGVAAMMNTALSESGRFIVVERNALSQVLTEQQLAAKGVSTGNAAPTTGNVIPAQYLVVGSVSEFGTADNGGGISIGGGITSALTSGLSLNRTTGAVAIDLRVVNTRTGAAEASFMVRKEITSTGIGLTTNYRGIALGGNQFFGTPLGEATRAAITEAAAKIAEAIASGKWEGQVVEVEGGKVYVNAGAEAGLKPGDVLEVQHSLRTFTDPATGAILSEQKATVGTIQLRQVDAKLASGDYSPADPAAPARGDLVVFRQ